MAEEEERAVADEGKEEERMAAEAEVAKLIVKDEEIEEEGVGAAEFIEGEEGKRVEEDVEVLVDKVVEENEELGEFNEEFKRSSRLAALSRSPMVALVTA